jgi:hypothetical protein
VGSDVMLALDCRQADWEGQEGDDWDQFNAGFEDGFQAGCSALSALPADGELHGDDRDYSELDCTNEGPGDVSSSDADIPQDVPPVGAPFPTASTLRSRLSLAWRSCWPWCCRLLLDELCHGLGGGRGGWEGDISRQIEVGGA